MKNIRIGFSFFGLLIVVLQSLPNIVWALRPPVPDPLKGNVSSVPFIETGEHLLGIAAVILLLFLVNKMQTAKIPRGGWTSGAFSSLALYWLCWALYFSGTQPALVIYAMVVLPPAAFFCAGAAEKIWPIPAVSAAFLAFHLLVSMENFPLSR